MTALLLDRLLDARGESQLLFGNGPTDRKMADRLFSNDSLSSEISLLTFILH